MQLSPLVKFLIMKRFKEPSPGKKEGGREKVKKEKEAARPRPGNAVRSWSNAPVRL